MPESVVELEAVLSHQEFLDFYQPVFNHALEHVELKGFRPGTAPKDLAEKAVDKEKVFHEAASEAVRNTLKKIMQEKSLKSYQTDLIHIAISLFEKRASHSIYWKESKAKEKFDGMFNK